MNSSVTYEKYRKLFLKLFFRIRCLIHLASGTSFLFVFVLGKFIKTKLVQHVARGPGRL